MQLRALLLLLLALLPALAIDFQDELTAPRALPPRRGGEGGARAALPPQGAADGVWQLPAADAELRAALRSAHSAEAARQASGLTAAHLQPLLLGLLNPQRAELSAREREAFGAEVARWAARQGLGAEEAQQQQRELSVSLLQQAASLRFLRSTAAALARVRSEERTRRKAESVLELAREAAAERRGEEAL
jgi:hypothetical protein